MTIGPFALSPAPAASSYGTLVSVFAVVSSLACVIGLFYAFRSVRKAKGVFPGVAPNDDLRKALDLRTDLSSKLFDLGLVLLGVIWGFVLTDKVVIQFSRWQDDALFVGSNLLLLTSLFSHLIYRLHLANMLWSLAGPLAPPGTDGKTPNPQLPDITSAYVETPFNIQWVLFFASLVSWLCTVIGVRLLGGPS